MFLERLNIFSDSNPYYRSKTFNKGLNTDLDMPNCTQYVVCRTYEACEVDKPFVMFNGRQPGSYPNAKNFFSETILPKGYDIREGSIAVFDGNFGHVAFVEKVIDQNHAVITQSQYSSNKARRDYMYWEKREAELSVGKATISGVGKLIGFVYLPIREIRVTERNASVDQISVKEQYLNVRVAPEGELYDRGCYLPMGLYNVIQTKEVNGWTWFEIATDRWVRDGEWLEYFKKQDINEDLLRENKILKDKIARIEEIIKE